MRNKLIFNRAQTTKLVVSLSFVGGLNLSQKSYAVSDENLNGNNLQQMGWIEDSLNMTLASEGFRWVSQLITDQNLQDVSRVPIDNVDEDVGGGVQAEVSGITYDIDFDRVEMEPVEQNIAVHVRLNSVTVRASDLLFRKRVGVVIRTKCEDVEITAGRSDSIDLYLLLHPQVNNGQLQLVESGLQFDVPEGNFHVSGPRHCDGALGVGSLISGTVHKILEHSRDKIVKSAQDRVRATIPKMENQINAMLLSSIPLNIGSGPALTNKKVIIRGRMRSIESRSSGLNTSMDISVEQALTNVFPDKSVPAEESDHNIENKQLLDAILANVSLRTQMINQLMQYAVPTISSPLPLDTQNGPAKQIFNRSALAGVLPDLNQLALDDEIIRANVGFGAPPTISTESGLNGSIDLSFSIPDLHLMLSVAKDGKILPYFDVKIATAFGIRINKEEGNRIVSLTLQNPRFVTVSGNWAPGYAPKVDIFEGDVAQILFKSALDYLFASQNVFRISAPSIPMGNNHSLEIAYPFTQTDKVGLALSGK